MQCIPTFRFVIAAAVVFAAWDAANRLLADEPNTGPAPSNAIAALDDDSDQEGNAEGKGDGNGNNNGSKENSSGFSQKVEDWTLGFKEGTPEHVVQRFCRRVLKGVTEGHDEFIKSGVRDRLLRSLRNGTIEDAQLAKLQDSLINAKLDKKESITGGVIVLLKNGEKETIQFSVQTLKEGTGLIQGLRIRD